MSLKEKTSLAIGGVTDELLLHRYDTIPAVMRLLADAKIPHHFLGGGTNVLIPDGELPWVVLHLPAKRIRECGWRETRRSLMRRRIWAEWSPFAQSTIWAAWKG